MPHVQKLYEKFKDRKDVQILTLNIDENVGLIDPFVKKNSFSFPVLPAQFFIDGVAPTMGIPQTWIIDPNGVLKMMQLGMGDREKWVEQMSEAIEKARGAG